MAIYYAKEIQSTYGHAVYPNNTYGNSSVCHLHGSNEWIYRAFLKHDLSGIPYKSKINSAKLYVYCCYLHDYGASATHNITRVMSDWNEDTLTWNNKPEQNTEMYLDEYVSSPDLNTWGSWDITRMVQEWVDKTYPNYGLQLVNNNEGAYRTEWRFYTKEANNGLATYIEIEYEPQEEYRISKSRMQELADEARRLGNVEGELTTAQMQEIFAGVTAGGVSSLNIAYGDTAPDDTSALWVKAGKPDAIELVNDFNGSVSFESNVGNLIRQVDISDASTTVGSKIYTFGGNDGSADYDGIQCYDTVTKTASIVANLPEPTNAPLVARIGNKIYIFGGYGKITGKLKAIRVFDTTSNTLVTLSATLGVSRENGSAVTVGKKIYIIGGNSTSSNTTPIEVFDSETETVETLNLNLNHAQSVRARAYGKKICIFDGYDLASTSSQYVFDTEDNTLTKLLWNIESGKYRGMEIIGRNAFTVGGHNYSGNMPYVKTFDMMFPTTPKTIYTLPDKIWSLSVVAIGNCAYLVGGNTASSGVQSSLHRIKVTSPLQRNTLLVELTDNDTYKLSNGKCVKNVYIGNENNEAEYVEAFMYMNGEWQHI